MKKFMLASVAASIALTLAAPAAAEPLQFTITGSRSATFILDSNATPTRFNTSSLIGDQIFFDNVAGTFAGTAGFADVNFGSGLIASLNVLNANLGFTQYSGPVIFSGMPARPIFAPGTFALNNPFFGNSSLTISRAAVTGAVPEPATWAMMLVGFGMAGTALRTRRRKNLLTAA